MKFVHFAPVLYLQLYVGIISVSIIGVKIVNIVVFNIIVFHAHDFCIFCHVVCVL